MRRRSFKKPIQFGDGRGCVRSNRPRLNGTTNDSEIGSLSRRVWAGTHAPRLASGLRSARLRYSLVSFLISSTRLRLPSPSFSISHCASEHSCEKRLNRNAAFRAPLLEFAASAPIISRRPGAAGYNRAFRRRGRAMGQTAARCGRTTDKLTAPWRKRAGKAAEGSEYGRQNV